MKQTKRRPGRMMLPLLVAAGLAGCTGQSTESASSAAQGTPGWRSGMAIQIYSFHDDLKRDLPGTLRRIKALGFDNVETFPLGGVTPTELRAALDAAGLRAVSAHMPWDRIKNDLPGVIADARILGVEQFGPGSINLFDGKGFRNLTLADADSIGADLTRACAAASAAGLRVFVHTHGNEFPDIGGTTPLERMSQVANNCFDIEADIYWVKWGGVDPVAFVRQYGKRVSSLHIKDMGAGAIGAEPGKIAKSQFPIAGRGIIDLPGLMRASREAGVRWYIVEDESDDPAGQIPHSLVYLDSIAVD
jgi:sugar phosphate isomerase/epimerase